MKTIILAAGRGSRMGSLTNDKPKCLVELGGKSLLQWQLEALKGAGISEIGIVRGYLADKLSISGIKYFENNNWQKTNMISSLSCAKEWLQNYTCIVSYSDIVYSIDTVNILNEAQGDIIITYDPNWLKLWKIRFEDPLIDAETFCVNETGKLIEIGNKANNFDEIKGQYMGLLKISQRGWKIIENYLSKLKKEESDIIQTTSLLQKLIKSGVEIRAVPIKDDWFEIDNENDLEIYNDILNERRIYK